MAEREGSSGLEARIARIETIVERLDRDDLELQDALDLFEEGVAHVREAYSLIEESRLRVEKLVVDMDGAVSLEPHAAE
jgi:exodeoxyribonuclease VII small subunit